MLASKAKGWEVCYLHFPTVLHHIGRSSEKIKLRSIYHHHRSIFLFYRKHYRRPVANSLFGLALFARALLLMVGRSIFGGGRRY